MIRRINETDAYNLIRDIDSVLVGQGVSLTPREKALFAVLLMQFPYEATYRGMEQHEQELSDRVDGVTEAVTEAMANVTQMVRKAADSATSSKRQKGVRPDLADWRGSQAAQEIPIPGNSDISQPEFLPRRLTQLADELEHADYPYGADILDIRDAAGQLQQMVDLRSAGLDDGRGPLPVGADLDAEPAPES